MRRRIWTDFYTVLFYSPAALEALESFHCFQYSAKKYIS